MTAKEVREYRNICKKLAEVEVRAKLLEDLKKNGICLADEEWFVHHEAEKFRILGNKRGALKKQHEELVSVSLKYKIRDNNLYGVSLRRKRNWLRGRLEHSMVENPAELKSILREVKKTNVKLKEILKKKNKKKVDHLVKKFGRSRNSKKTEVDDNMTRLVGTPDMLNDDIEIQRMNIVDPVIVEQVGEKIVLTENERAALRLGPKFCVFNDLNDETFECDIEECLLKVKWDMMGDEPAKERDTADVAMEFVLGKELCNQIEEENLEEKQLIKAGDRMIFNWDKKTFYFFTQKSHRCKG